MYAHPLPPKGAIAKVNVNTHTDMRRLPTEIRSEKRVVRRFRRCANVYLHKPRQYSTVQPTTHLGYTV